MFKYTVAIVHYGTAILNTDTVLPLYYWQELTGGLID